MLAKFVWLLFIIFVFEDRSVLNLCDEELKEEKE